MLVGYTVAGFAGFYVTLASLPAWLASLGTDSAVAGLTTTGLLVTTIGLQVFVPELVRRLGAMPVLAGGLIALGAPSLLLLINSGAVWVIAVSAVRGGGFGVLTVLGATMAARAAAAERRGEAIGIYGFAISSSSLVMIPAGVALVSAGQFPWVAVAGAVPLLGLVTLRALARGIDFSSAPDSGSSRAGRRAAAIATIAPASVLLVVTLAGGAFSTYVPIALPGGHLATVALLVWGATGALARWRAGLLADRLGTARLLPIGSGTVVVGVCLIAGGLLAHSVIRAALLLVGAAVFGVGYGAGQNLTLAAALARVGENATTTASSVWNIGFDTGTALGAAPVGALASLVDIPGALLVTAVLVGATVPLASRCGLAGSASSAPG
jgi:predicted MFS family arabinose efflux permease